MDASRALGPVMFRFTDPEDVELYGDRWYRYAEEDVIRLRARALIELEIQLGMPVVNIMNGARMHSTLGDLGAAWLGVRAHDPELAGPFEKFNPLTLAITWANPADVDEVDEGKEEPEDSGPMPTISAQMDTVTLPTLPIAE
jgi:hypothetical protein